MNATALYVSTCRYILQADYENGESWGDLYRLLPYLRQSLSCCVCGSLLNDPLGPTDSNCQHFVCRKCLGGKMLLKPSCSWCKNYEKFAEVRQLRILLSCYKKLCEYIAATPIARSFVGANGESNSTLTILQEGMAINAVHESSSANPDKGLNILDFLAKANRQKTADADSRDSKSPGRRRGRPRRDTYGVGASPNPHPYENPEVPSPALDSPLNGLCNGLDSSDHLDLSSEHSFYSASFSSCGSSRIKIKRKRHNNELKVKSKKKKKKRDKIKQKERELMKEEAKRRSNRKARNERKKRRHRYQKETDESESEIRTEFENDKPVNGSEVSSSPEEFDTPRKKTLVISGHRAKMLKAGKSLTPILGCRCGTWGKSPGANTCRGNRCPCFMTEKGCERCKCKGCRNPFIVPESPPPKKRQRHSSRHEVNGESELNMDATNA